MSSRRSHSQKINKKQLPHGWIVVPSKSYPDRVYFYNTISKCSTWENPCKDYTEKPETSQQNETPKINNKRKYNESFTSINSNNNKVKPIVPKSAFASPGDDDDDSMLVDEIEDYDEDHNDYFDNVPMNNFSLRQSEARSPPSPKSPVTMFFSSDIKPEPPISKVIPNEERKELWTYFLNPKAKKSLVLSDLETSSNKTISDIGSKVASPPRKKIIRSRVLDSIKEKAQKSSPKRDPVKLTNANHSPKFKSNGEKSSINSRLSKIPRIAKSLGSDKCDLSNLSPLGDGCTNEQKTPAQRRLAKVREKNVETVVKAAGKSNSPKKQIVMDLKNNKSKEPTGKNLRKDKSSKVLTLDQLTEKQKDSIGKRFERLREKALEEAKEYLANNNILPENENILAHTSPSKKKKVVFVGETTNEFIQSEPINVTQYIDEFHEEEMEWEPSDEQEMIKHINEIRKNLSKETELSNHIYMSDRNIESNKNAEILSWIVVVDTNILLSSLSFIKDLRDTKINNLGYPVIYIPWRVLQELDHLKDSQELQVGARRAINYINENFIASHPRFRGQSFQEFSSMSKSESESPDDDILQSCLYLQKKETNKKLILLTNDKNFESKAILCGVKAYSKERFQREVSLSDERSNRPVAEVSNHLNNSVVDESDKKLCELKVIMKNLLVYVVETELKLAYGDVWKKMVKNEVWTLPELIDCFIKYWRAVFNYVFPKDVLSEMENLKRALKKNVIAGKDEVSDVIQISQQLLAHMKLCREIRPYMDDINTSLKDISLLLNTPCASSAIQYVPSSPSADGSINGNETIITQIKQEKIDDFDSGFCDIQIHLDKITHIFREIWNYVREAACNVEKLTTPENHDTEIDESLLENMKIQLPEMSSNFQDLIVAIEKVTKLNETEINPTNPDIINLSKLLLKFAMSANLSLLDLMPVDSLPLSVAFFCGEVTERELLSKSLSDFKQFQSILASGIEYIQSIA